MVKFVIELWDHQEKMVHDSRLAFRNHRNVLLQGPTGVGKTRIASRMMENVIAKNKTAFFICHRRELIDQTASTLDGFGIPFGYIAAGLPNNYYQPVQICSIDTLKNRIGNTPLPHLCIWDECVSGNTLIKTDVGEIEIKDTERLNASKVLSYDGMCNTMLPINGFRNVGTKNIIGISVGNHQLKCTAEHLIYTKKGWVEACQIKTGMELLVSVDAKEKQPEIKKEGHENLSSDIRHQVKPEVNQSGMSDTNNILSDHLFVNVDAKGTCHQDIKPLIPLLKTEEPMTLVSTLQAIRAIRTEVNSLCQITKRQPFLAPYSETLAFCTRILDQQIQGLHSTIQQNNLNGHNINPNFLNLSECKLNTKITQGLEIYGQVETHLALVSLLKFIQSHIHQELNKLQKNGSIRSTQSVLLGGIATMGTSNQQGQQLHSILKDLTIKKSISLLDSLNNATDQLDTISTTGERSLYSQWDQQKKCLKKSTLMSQIFLDTNWVLVKEVSEYSAEKVYDISVEGSQCFYANGILTHNCHHVGAKGWEKVHGFYDQSFHLGLSATPERLDGKGLDKCFDHLVHGPQVDWLIENNFLANFKLFSVPGVEMGDVHTQMGDFVKKESAEAMNKPTITGNIIDHWKKYAPDRLTIGFAVTIEHSKHLVEQFNLAGIPAAHLDGTMRRKNPKEFRRTLRDLAKGVIKVVFNVGLFGEGFDLAMNSGLAVTIGCVIDASPTQSLGAWLQRCGRTLRPQEWPAIILDHAGNWGRHGSPSDHREWTLLGRDSRATGGGGGSVASTLRQCGECFFTYPFAEPACPMCGAVPKSKKIKEVAGELQQINPEMIRQQMRKEMGQARSPQELKDFAVMTGKKPNWANHVHEARQEKNRLRITLKNLIEGAKILELETISVYEVDKLKPKALKLNIEIIELLIKGESNVEENGF